VPRRIAVFALLGVAVVPSGNRVPVVDAKYVCTEVDGKDICVIVSEVGDSSGGAGARVVCTAWTPWLPPTDQDTPAPDHVFDVRNGIEWDLYSRVCNGDVVEYRKFPQVTSRDLAQAAHDSVASLVPTPELHMSRDVDDLIVNVATTIAVTPVDPVSATAEIPGRSATVTATAKRIEVLTGSLVATDVQRIECAPWGGPECTWTPVYPSVLKVTGTDDHRHHGSVSIVWHVAWTSSDGDGGDLGELTTTTPVLFAVREIQIIGG
jgi:hypothetical protein